MNHQQEISPKCLRNIAGATEADRHDVHHLALIISAFLRWRHNDLKRASWEQKVQVSATATSRCVQSQYPGWTASKGALFHNP
jgi:hypothetical protein